MQPTATLFAILAVTLGPLSVYAAPTEAAPTNSFCPNADDCVSTYGHCGKTVDYCGATCVAGPCWPGMKPETSAPASSNGAPTNSFCPNADDCVSTYGHCGRTVDYCGSTCVAGPCWPSAGPSTTFPGPQMTSSIAMNSTSSQTNNVTVTTTTNNNIPNDYTVCPYEDQCMSSSGFCGTGADYCGLGCAGGACWEIGHVESKSNAHCPNVNGEDCVSAFGHCGKSAEYCGAGCQGGPCYAV